MLSFFLTISKVVVLPPFAISLRVRTHSKRSENGKIVCEGIFFLFRCAPKQYQSTPSHGFSDFLLEHCEHFEHDEQPMQVGVPDLRAA